MGYIYKITNTINNKVNIGKTIFSIEERWKRHQNNYKKLSTKFYNAIKKYGIENFSIEELEECSNDLLNEREQFWIKSYNSYEKGYNSTRGGDGGFTLSDSQIERIVSLYKEGQCIRDIKKITGCTIETISFYVKKELKLTDEEIRARGYELRKKKQQIPVAQFDLEGNLINTFNSYKEAQEATGVWYTHIGNVCNGKRATAGGFIWKKIKGEDIKWKC